MANKVKREPIPEVIEAIDALGGNAAVAAMTDVGLSTVSQWKHRGFPPETYKLIADALSKQKRSASLNMWPKMRRRKDRRPHS